MEVEASQVVASENAIPALADPIPKKEHTNHHMLRLITQRISLMRRSEKRVAEFVLTRPHECLDQSIGSFAAMCSVSEPTVARFCQVLGCTGFKQFKLMLAKALGAGVDYVHRDVSPGDPSTVYQNKVFDSAIATLMKVRDQLDPIAVEHAVEMLCKARRIEIYGLGNSAIVAADAQHKLFRLGVSAVAYSDPHVQCMAATLLTPQDVVVAISSTGRTKELLDAVNLSIAAGAHVVAITRAGSQLALLSHIALEAMTDEDPDIFTPMTSRLAHLVIVDTLAVGIALQSGPELQQQLARAKDAILRRRLPASSS